MQILSAKYRFGPYEVRVRTRELFKEGTRLKLRPQPFRVLQVLVERAGDVVTREELREMLWPGETFVDFEHGLNTSIKEIRKALSDSATEPRFIETLPKLGYRLMAAIEAEPAPIPTAPETAPPVAAAMPASGFRIRSLMLMAAVPTVALAAWLAVNRRPSVETSPAVPLTSLPGMVQAPMWSPDGRKVAFAWNGEKQDHFDIYVVQPGSTSTARLTTADGGDDDINPAWSWDGKWIAYVTRAHGSRRSWLNLVPAGGGLVRRVLQSETPMGRVSWTPNARAVVLEIVPAPEQPAVLWMVWLDTGRHAVLTSPPRGIPGDTAPSVSPDGRTVAFCRATFWRTAELYLLDLKRNLSPAGVERRITNFGWVTWPSWTPDSVHILFSSRRDGTGILQVDPDGRNLHPIIGPPEAADRPTISRRPGGYESLVFTLSSGATRILRLKIAHPDEKPAELAASPRLQGCPRYSPDGKRLAFYSDRSGYQEIWVASADGSEPVRLTNLRHQVSESPEWSPAGDRIAFVSQERAERQIYVVSASGGTPLALTGEAGVLSGGGWTRDGSGYYYTSQRSGRAEVWMAPLAGGEPRQMTESGGRCGFESPRGAFYYWEGEGGNAGKLFRRTTNGDQEVQLGMMGRTCRTAPAAKGFYFISASRDVYLYDETAERSTRVLPYPASALPEPHQLVAWFTVSPDGNWFAMDTPNSFGSNLMIMEHFRE